MVILESGLTNPQLGLRALSRALSQRGIAKNIVVFSSFFYLMGNILERSWFIISPLIVQVIAKARVPIIKFVEKKSNIAFDLRFFIFPFAYYLHFYIQ